MVAPAGLRLVIAEPWRLVREGLAALCQGAGGHRVVAQASDGEAARDAIERYQPDVALLDLGLERTFALEVVRRFSGTAHAPKFVILSTRCDRKTVLEVLRGGAQGFVSKAAAAGQLQDCLEHVSQGSIYVSPDIDVQGLFASSPAVPHDALDTLSAREHQVFSLLVEGIRPKEIAARLNLSPKTVDTYRAGLMRKLDIHDLASLVKYAIGRSLVAG